MNNIRLALRNLLRNKVFMVINLVGLTIAILISNVLLLYGYYHLSFEKRIPENDKIYRVISCVKNGEYRASTFGAFEEPLSNRPEIESVTTFYCHHQEQEFIVDNNVFSLKKVIQADAGFLKFFGIQPITGDADGLDNSNTVMLSTATAKLIFGDTDPIGKVLLTGSCTPDNPNKTVYTVVGVLDQVPGNSHLSYDIILSKKGAFEGSVNSIKNSKIFGAYIYVKSAQPMQNSDLENQLATLVSPALDGKHGPPLDAFQHKFQKLNDIHFNIEIRRDFGVPVSKLHLNILFIIGTIVLITVFLNFLIMNMGISAFRLKQTKIVYFLGGKPFQIFNSIFWENTIIVFLSFATALILIRLLKSPISGFLSNQWEISYYLLPILIMTFILFLLVIFITWFTTTTGLKLNSKPDSQITNFGFKKTTPILLFQFIAVFALLAFTILIKKQLSFIENKELGFKAENVVVFHIEGPATIKVVNLKQRVKMIPGVESAGVALHFPGRNFQNQNLETRADNFPFEFAMTDQDVIQTLGIKTKVFFSDVGTTRFYINETFYNSLSKRFTEQQIVNGDFSEEKNDNDPANLKFKINGVVNDFHYNPLYSTIGNFAFFVGEPQTFPDRYLLARVNQKNLKEITAKIAAEIRLLFPDNKLEPTLLDDQLQSKYLLEAQLLKATNLFSWITVAITCFGLFAFSLATILRKTKEIGIRKVNGAKTSEILVLLNRDFVKWVLLAVVIATPIAWYAMHKWLENFAYKTELSWWIFALAGLLALGIALLTVSFQSWRAATRNPVEALRYE